MNWKRGLVRIYVILWAAFAAFGGYQAFVQSNRILFSKQSLDKERAAHPELTAEGFRELLVARVSADNANPNVGLISSYMDRDELETLDSPDYQHPVVAHAKIWGLWLLVCGLGPGALLALISWIVKGFSK